MFHLIDFATMEEAAAFVAALSRVLNSPGGSALGDSAKVFRPVERKRLYLNESALTATASAFGPLPDLAHAHQLPADSVLILDGPNTPALGLAQALVLLSKARRPPPD